MDVQTIVYLVVMGLSLVFNVVAILASLKKKKEATTTEEKDKLNELIKNQMVIATEEIKNLATNLGLKVTGKQILKATKNVVKGEK
ncbi:hypothetical protein [Dipodfec virus UOA04_Rod_907]|nr:hypothetical protein [Dipodfec virus UOA04_Rod_907]